ncbi:hypothetical protein ACVWWF_001932 [Pseudomonas tolaasii]
MLTSDHQRQGFHPQGQGVDVLCVYLVKPDAHIELVGQQLVFHLFLGEFAHGQRDVRIASVKGCHQRPDQIGGEGGGHCYAQRTAAEVAHVVECAFAFLQLLRSTQGITQVNLAGIGEAGFAPGAVEQLRAKAFFQLPHLL